MSKFVVASGFGGPEALLILDEEVADSREGEVRVVVRDARVNPVDQKRYSGRSGPRSLPVGCGARSGVVERQAAEDLLVGDGPLAS